MKYLTLFAVLLAVFFAVPSADASNYVLGSGGYYWRAGVAYERTPCVANGRNCWRYTVVQNVSNKTVNNYTAAPKNWKVSVIDQLAKDADNEAYLAALAQLKGRRYQSPYGVAQTYQLNQSGVAGQTVYSGFDAKAFYNTVDRAAIFQLQALTTQQAQGYAADGARALSDNIREENAAAAAVAVIFAKAQSDAAVLQAAKETVTRTVTSTATSGTAPLPAPSLPGQPLTPPVAAKPPEAAEDPLSRVVQTRCLQCHSSGKKEGGLDLTKDEISDAEWAKVIARVNSTDPSKVMPRDAKGGPAPLPKAEKDLFK